MFATRIHDQKGSRRCGTVVPLVVLSSTGILGFTALTVDVGMMYNTRAQLQASADAAVLAGA